MQENIERGPHIVGSPQKFTGLQSKGREGRKRAHKTDKEQGAGFGGDRYPVLEQGPERADHETSDRVDRKGTPGESRAGEFVNHAGKAVTGESSEGAGESQPEHFLQHEGVLR